MESFTQEEIIRNIPNFSSEKLCSMIACHRYLGFSEEIAIASMEELGKRRINGDAFEFEQFIDNCLADLPPLSFNTPDLRQLIQQIGKIR